MAAFMSTASGFASSDVVAPCQSDTSPTQRSLEAHKEWHMVWCHEWIHKDEYCGKREVVSAAVEACGGTLHCLKKASTFASWLARADAPENYILLTNWRLTKPCADVLTQQPYACRPALAIINCEHASHPGAASSWLELTGHTLANFHVTEQLQLDDAFFTKGFFNGLATRLFRGESLHEKTGHPACDVRITAATPARCLYDSPARTPAHHEARATCATEENMAATVQHGKSAGYWEFLPQPWVQCANAMLMIVSAVPVLPTDVCNTARQIELVLNQAMPDHYED